MNIKRDKVFTKKNIDTKCKAESAFLGLAVGDALGVPVEFTDRDILKRNPVIDMTGYGTHNQPPGTFSDDSSLAFCLAEALTQGFNLRRIAGNFSLWCYEGFWTAHGSVFDIGIATRKAIARLSQVDSPDRAGGSDEYSNGNGSLMRILPLLFYIKNKPVEERWEITKQVSSITHAHIRSVIACFYYLEFAGKLLDNKSPVEAYSLLQIKIPAFLETLNISPEETQYFDRLLKSNIYEFPEDAIYSSGYVVHTLEASIWCLMTTENYKDAVLKAVNLGDDTDTTGAVTGGLAGLLYGKEGIPDNWLLWLARKSDIENLAVRLDKKVKIDNSDFIATLKYRKTNEGGRTTPANTGYFPLIKFSFDTMHTGGKQIFIDKEIVKPGETVKAAVFLMSAGHFKNQLSEGMEFDVVEVPNQILAKGIIEEILNDDLKRNQS